MSRSLSRTRRLARRAPTDGARETTNPPARSARRHGDDGGGMNYDLEAARLKKDWAENPRWKGVERGYSAEDVVRLRGSLHIEHTLARRGAEKLWKLISDEPFVNTLGALTGNQALQQVKAGLKAIYLSGWQVAADANIAGEMYPDQSLYPANSVPAVVRRINNTFIRADQIQHAEGKDDIDLLRADRRRCRSRDSAAC